MEKTIHDSLKLQKQMFFNSKSDYQELVDKNNEAEKLIIVAKQRSLICITMNKINSGQVDLSGTVNLLMIPYQKWRT